MNDALSDSPAAGRFPWALALALLIVAGFELYVRSWPTNRLIAYRDDGEQTTAVRQMIEAGSAPDVAFVGSSQTYQGIATPELEKWLSALTGRPTSVRNFAIRGGRVDLFEATVRDMVRQPTKPKLIVVGIGMRDVRESKLDLDRLADFWQFSDWRHERRRRWLADQLPVVVRNAVGECWWTLRHRTGIALCIEQQFIESRPEPMPARGERPSQHEGAKRNQSLADDLGEFKRPTMKRRMIQAYRPELPAKPPTVLTERLESLIDLCDDAHVKLMFVEMPLSQPLRDLIDNAQKKAGNRDASRDFEPAFRSLMSRVAKRAQKAFVQSDRMDVRWKNEDFFDGQHLNFAGAQKLTSVLAPMIAKELR